MDFLHAAVEGGRDGIPEMQEGILFHADVDEHGLQAGFDILDPALEDAADGVVVAFAFYLIFFEEALFEEGDAAFELFNIDNDGISLARVDIAEPQGSLDLFEHD